MALKFLLILIILGFWFSGCKRNPAPEVRNLLKDTKIGRLDLDLFLFRHSATRLGVLQKIRTLLGYLYNRCVAVGESL